MLVLVAIFMFAAVGMAQAYSIDGMVSAGSPVALPNAGLTNYVNPGGMGDALIYGYYNALGSASYVRIVNTSQTLGVGAKVRFREGRNSNEVLDFYICLSAGDQWTAYVSGTNDNSGAATLISMDTDTPTYPSIPTSGVALKSGNPSVVTAADTKEGYLEIIGNVAWSDKPGSGKAVKTSNDCGYMVLNASEAPTSDSGLATLKAAEVDVPNSLAGTMLIYNGSTLYSFAATALADFRSTPKLGSLGVDSVPTLSDADNGIAEVNYALTKDNVYSTFQYASDGTLDTAIINTFPTKRRSLIDSGSGPNATAAGTARVGGSINGPFNDTAYIDSTGAVAGDPCEVISVLQWDDKENTPGSSVNFSPSTPQQKTKCYEVNLVAVGSKVSIINTNLTALTLSTSYSLGRADETFNDGTDTKRVTTLGTGVRARTTYGLPVISITLQSVGSTIQALPSAYSTLIK